MKTKKLNRLQLDKINDAACDINDSAAAMVDKMNGCLYDDGEGKDLFIKTTKLNGIPKKLQKDIKTLLNEIQDNLMSLQDKSQEAIDWVEDHYPKHD